MRTSILFLVGFLMICGLSAGQDNDKRLAIVIGNSKYLYSGELPNPVNDARAIRDALQGVGFEVFEYENLTQSQMKSAIDNFGTRLKNYSTGLFFYAGHGIQSKGSNYLIPVDANIQSEQQIEYDCVQADRVLGFMEAAGSKVNIVILDACRNNPFERSWSRAMDGSGLAFMNAPTGSLIAYATSPGRTASDGLGSNGLYTSALLENLKTPDITILQMFQNVRRTVTDKSAKHQIPWESTSLTADFFFVNKDKIEKGKVAPKGTWTHFDDSYSFYINDEEVNSRITGAWSDEDLLVYDNVTNSTFLINNYEKSPKNQKLNAKFIGYESNWWKSNNGFYYVFVKGEMISGRTSRSFVDNDLLVYDSQTNTTFLLENYKNLNDNTLRPAKILDNADFAFWRKNKNNEFWLFAKGEEIQTRTYFDYAGNDLIAYDTVANITYLFKNFYVDENYLKLTPAPVLSYQDNIFWTKTGNLYALYVKGRSIQEHTTCRFEGDDLFVTDNKTKITYILLDYANASDDQYRVAMVSP